MSQFGRNSAITGAVLFLEAAAAYLAMGVITLVTGMAAAQLPLWLALLTLGWAFLLSLYIQTIRFSLNLRGVIGLFLSGVSLLTLAAMGGMGFMPLGRILAGDIQTAFVLALTLAFLVTLWWRGSSLAHDEVTLETARGSFQWGLGVVVGTVIIDAVTPGKIVPVWLVVGFFAVGLAGLSLARFAAEAGDGQGISRDWFLPIGAMVGGVLLLALFISGLGLGGLDDGTRWALRTLGTAGNWILRPILLGLGYVAAALVALGHWLTGVLGGGDLSGLTEAQEQLRRFHENLEEVEGDGPPGWVYGLLRAAAVLAATALGGWLLFRVFRFRRLLRRAGEVQESRESLFTWGKANRDLFGAVNGWWNNLVQRATAEEEKRPEPANPREVYHRFLELAEGIGHPKGEGQTPREHQGAVEDTLPEAPVDRIVGGFQRSHYGQQETGSGELEELRRDWETLRQYEGEVGGEEGPVRGEGGS